MRFTCHFPSSSRSPHLVVKVKPDSFHSFLFTQPGTCSFMRRRFCAVDQKTRYSPISYKHHSVCINAVRALVSRRWVWSRVYFFYHTYDGHPQGKIVWTWRSRVPLPSVGARGPSVGQVKRLAASGWHELFLKQRSNSYCNHSTAGLPYYHPRTPLRLYQSRITLFFSFHPPPLQNSYSNSWQPA